MSVKTRTISPLSSAGEQVILTLPTNLMEAVREKAPNDSNQFIVTAIDFYLDAMRARRARLMAGYQANAEADAALAAEWSAIDNESWLRHVPPYGLAEEPRFASAPASWAAPRMRDGAGLTIIHVC